MAQTPARNTKAAQLRIIWGSFFIDKGQIWVNGSDVDYRMREETPLNHRRRESTENSLSRERPHLPRPRTSCAKTTTQPPRY